jgi:O-antigen ligase
VATGKNGLGMLCLVFGLVCLWNLVNGAGAPGRKSNQARLAYGVVIVMACWLLWISDSKTSLACFAIAGGVMIATTYSQFFRTPVVLHTLVGVVVLISFMVLFLGVGGNLLEMLGRDSTLTGRTSIWEIALDYAENPIFGAGYETFWLGSRLQAVAADLGTDLNQAHNGYVEIYLNLGWMGICLLGMIVLSGYRNITAAVREDRDSGQLRLAYFTIAVIYNFTEGMFKFMSPVWIFFLMSSMTVPTAVARPAAVASKPRGSTPERTLPGRTGLAARAGVHRQAAGRTNEAQ